MPGHQHCCLSGTFGGPLMKFRPTAHRHQRRVGARSWWVHSHSTGGYATRLELPAWSQGGVGTIFVMRAASHVPWSNVATEAQEIQKLAGKRLTAYSTWSGEGPADRALPAGLLEMFCTHMVRTTAFKGGAKIPTPGNLTQLRRYRTLLYRLVVTKVKSSFAIDGQCGLSFLTP